MKGKRPIKVLVNPRSSGKLGGDSTVGESYGYTGSRHMCVLQLCTIEYIVVFTWLFQNTIVFQGIA